MGQTPVEMPTPRKPGLLPVAAALALLGAVVFASAWQSDDAYITFRTAENLWNGWGLRWNTVERVQSFTSPVWLLLATMCRGVFGELYFSTLAAGLTATLVAGALLIALDGGSWRSILLVVALSTSAAVVDYSTSGLENPLLYVLLVFVVREGSRPEAPSFVLRMALLTSALALTRPDAVLFTAPAVAWTLFEARRNPRAWRDLAAGATPLVLWVLFSLIYFGSPIPNTALAKLNVDLSTSALVVQGLRYLLDSIRYDPVTLVLIVAGVVSSLRGNQAHRLIAGGVVLYLLYVVRIGGDFMSGRFLAAPAVASAALLLVCLPRSRMLLRPKVTAGAVAALALYGLLWPHGPWLSGPQYGRSFGADQIVRGHGIADERAYYYPTTGLLPILLGRSQIRARGLPIPPYRGAQLGQQLRNASESVVTMNEVGFFGYFAGPDKTIVDVWALADPLLARLQFHPEGAWRIGHYRRRLPEGYVERRRGETGALADPEIAKLYDAIEVVTQAPLFADGRWREIWRLNTGYYRDIQRKQDYR